jgi:hypothetical protein
MNFGVYCSFELNSKVKIEFELKTVSGPKGMD